MDHWFLCLELKEYRIEHLQGVGKEMAVQLVGWGPKEAIDCLHLPRRVGGRILPLALLLVLALFVEKLL